MIADKPQEYTVLARRFRPQTFSEVIGQDNVSQSLRNAIAGGRVAHAYLFTGARGVGKTSMARILAKSLNCPDAKDGTPCNECEVCQSITAGGDVDVLEIDGASNRGIEDVRSLRANVNVRSMRSRYKIYIIDEVHMLTREAFNALLKTLEEPPPNVKFVFCTTEPQKLPDTILSRCQRFDFGTISSASIQQRLTEIATAEGVEVEPAAIEVVARRAAGSMRDSQSLFDQLLAYGQAKVLAADVHRLLGTAPDSRLIELFAEIVSRRRDRVLELFHAALNEGVQLSELTDQLLNYLRDLMILAAGANEVDLLSVSAENRGHLAKQATDWGLQTILAALQILAEAKGRMKGVTYGRALAELALVRMASLEDLEGLPLLIEQVRSGSPLPAAMPARLSAPEKKNDSAGVKQVDGGRWTVDGGPQTQAAPEKPSAVALEPVASSPPDDNPPSTVHRPPSTISLEPGSEAAILLALQSRLGDMLGSYVKNVRRLAISGPNRLVLSFPSGYDQTKQYLERPDQLSRLANLAGEIVGRPVSIALQIDEVLAGEPAPKPMAPRSVAPTSRADPSKDPFLQHVKSVFGANIVKQDVISVAASISAVTGSEHLDGES
ncbi:MAG: DNA polymerase III subunit gamma/tau [Planctomycetales bacterium]|nr:DNA polymerase III subunit gamma/tau [Planctomycetales bacterium]